jgi:hypothetical protein
MYWWIFLIIPAFYVIRFLWKSYTHPVQTLSRQAVNMNWAAKGRMVDEHGYKNTCFNRDGLEAFISYKNCNVILTKPSVTTPFSDFIEIERWIVQREIGREIEEKSSLGVVNPANKFLKFTQKPSCGTVTFDENGKATIISKDASSTPHAMGHIALRMLYRMTREAPPPHRQMNADLAQKAEKWAGVRNGQWSDQQEEEFASQFVIYTAERFPALRPDSNNQPLSHDLQEIFEALCPLNKKKPNVGA